MEKTVAIPNRESPVLQQAGGKAVVLFDGVCNLCNGAVDFIISQDVKGRFLFASLQSEAGQELLKHYGLPGDQFDSMVLLKDNKLYKRSTAALEIAGELPHAWSLLSVFKLIPVPLRDAIYNFIARNRFRFWGKKSTCRLPTPKEQSHFLG